MQSKFLNAYRFFSEAHLIIAFAAFCQVRMTQFFFSITDTHHIAVFFALSTFIVYNFYSVYTAFFHPNNFEKHRIIFWQRYRQYYLLLLLIVMGVTLLKFYFLLPVILNFSLQHFIAFFILGMLSIVYGVPCYKNTSLRDLPFIKIFIISLVWASMVFSYQLSESYQLSAVSHQQKVYFLFIEKFCFVFTLALLCDINDASWDKQNHIKTIPNYFGLKKTKYLIYALLFIVAGLDFYLFSSVFLFASLVTVGITFFITKNTDLEMKSVFFKDLVDALLVVSWLVSWLVLKVN